MGVRGTFSVRFQPSSIQKCVGSLPVFRHSVATSFYTSDGAESLCWSIGQRTSEYWSWDDAVSFCEKLSDLPEEKAARRSYRLPTEAEWEYACRASSSASYSFGDVAESLGEYAWFGDGKTHPVGEKKPNRWGLYDMHGNVWEWCQDWYAEYPPDASTDPKGPKWGTDRVIRGHSWCDDAGLCRSASRAGLNSWIRINTIGFRVALIPSVK